MKLTDEQVDFILQDVRDRGITLDELADNLVDHICCLMENGNEENFEQSYQRALGSFGQGGLREIEENTKLLLILKREITMKKLMFIMGYLAAFIISYGVVARLLLLGGGGLSMFVGILVLNFGFLPLFFYYQHKTTESMNILMSVLGYLSSVLMSTGAVILVLQIGTLHHPQYGGYILASGMALLLLIVLPWYLVTNYKKTTASAIPH